MFNALMSIYKLNYRIAMFIIKLMDKCKNKEGIEKYAKDWQEWKIKNI